MDILIIILLGFGAMWLLIILPQRRRQSAHERMLTTIEPGDEVVTAGGLYGTVTEADDEDVGLEIAEGVEVRVARRAIAAVLPPDEDEYEEDEEEPFEPAAEGSEPAEPAEQLGGARPPGA